MPSRVAQILILTAALALCLCAGCRKPPPPAPPVAKLTGGVRLVYSVTPGPASSPSLLADTVAIMRQRVDPAGVLDIRIAPFGTDRIEVLIPAQSARELALRADFEAALHQAVIPPCSRADVERIAKLPAVSRPAEIDRCMGGDLERRDRLQRAVEELETLEAASAEYESAARTVSDFRQSLRNAANDSASVSQLNEQLTKAQAHEAEKRKAAAIASAVLDESVRAIDIPGLDEAFIRRTLRLADEPLIARDQKNATVSTASARSIAIDALAAAHPGRAEAIRTAAAKWKAYAKAFVGLDDAQFIELIRDPGLLEFRIAVTDDELPMVPALCEQLRAGGPHAVQFEDARFYPVKSIVPWVWGPEDLSLIAQRPREFFARRGLVAEAYGGRCYILCWDKRGKRLTAAPEDGQWSVAKAHQGTDQLGHPAIDFELDVLGGNKLSQLSGNNLGKPLAVILDGEICSAPTLQSRISNRGQIVGGFMQREIDYMVRILGHNRLPPELSPEPISREKIEPASSAP